MALTIRDAVAADAPAIRAVAGRAWPAAYEGLFEPAFIELVLERTYDPAQLADAIAAPGGHFLVAEDGGEVAGYLHYAGGELNRLYVEPERIGTGAGRLLLAELERRLPSGSEYVALVREGNERAVAFYLRQGFEIADRVDGFGRFAEAWGLDLGSGAGRDLMMRRRLPHVRS
ncbi:MAG: GNAT family N-acetyltransferase [Thermoleophilaceae bacterium]